MRVSIITATRNAGKHIVATLDSVAEQLDADIEHVIIDGASTDNTAAAVRTFNSSQIRFRSEPDRGIYDAFNKGLQVASGEIIAFLNAGDIYTNNRVVATASALLKAQAVDAVFGDVQLVDQDHHAREIRRISSKAFSPNKLRFGMMPAHPTLFVRRSLYNRLVGYDSTYAIAGDYELCLRAFLVHGCTFAYLPEVLTRMTTGGVSNQGLRSVMTITREMRRACAANGIRTNYLKLLARLPLKLFELRIPGAT